MEYRTMLDSHKAQHNLIEAAPDMLAALRLAESALDTYRTVGAFAPGQPSGWLLRTIRSAIARATGSTPQGTAAAVAEALGRSPTEPGTARLAADLEAAEDRAPSPGMVIVADWAGGDAQRMRLVSRYEHPAGNGWRVNIYDHRAKRFSKIEQSVSDQTVEAALLAGRVE